MRLGNGRYLGFNKVALHETSTILALIRGSLETLHQVFSRKPDWCRYLSHQWHIFTSPIPRQEKPDINNEKPLKENPDTFTTIVGTPPDIPFLDDTSKCTWKKHPAHEFDACEEG